MKNIPTPEEFMMSMCNPNATGPGDTYDCDTVHEAMDGYAKLVGKTTMKKLIDECSQIINDFLMENGGLDNGYITWAAGEVNINVRSSLSFKTPKNDERTGAENNELGYKAYSKLVECMKKHECTPSDTLVISIEHMEHGCYRTFIHMRPERKQINLWMKRTKQP